MHLPLTLLLPARVIVPIFLIIGAGVLLDRWVRLDLPTLSKLSFVVFMPAIVLVTILENDLDLGLTRMVLAFTLIHAGLLLPLSWALFSIGPFRPRRSLLTLGAIVLNAGNYGLPLAVLAFGQRGTGVMAIILMGQTLISFTLGVVLMAPRRRRWQEMALELVKVPVLDVMALALLLRLLRVDVPEAVMVPIRYLADGLVPIALLTLGVQIRRSRGVGRWADLGVVTVVRLLLSPLLGLFLIALWPLLGGVDLSATAPILVAAMGLPVAVNVYIFALEYDREPELASQMVFWTTLLSALTLTFWLTLVG